VLIFYFLFLFVLGATYLGWSVQHLLALAGFVAYHLDAAHFHPRCAV